MKRSDVITIGVVFGAAATAVLWRVASGPAAPAAPEEMVFAGGSGVIAHCVDAGIALNTCAADYQRALSAHYARAPLFASAEECQDVTDSACEPRVAAGGSATSGFAPGSLFSPVMAGFVLSQLMGQGQGGAATYVSTPVYASRTSAGSYRALADLRREQDDQSSGGSGGGGGGGGGSSSGKNRQRPATLKPYASSSHVNMKTTSVSRSGFGGSGSGGFGG